MEMTSLNAADQMSDKAGASDLESQTSQSPVSKKCCFQGRTYSQYCSRGEVLKWVCNPCTCMCTCFAVYITSLALILRGPEVINSNDSLRKAMAGITITSGIIGAILCVCTCMSQPTGNRRRINEIN